MYRWLLAPAALWLAVFVALPSLILLAVAMGHSVEAVPPVALGLSFGKLGEAVTDPLYLGGFLASLQVAFVSAAICLVIGYPMALAIARSRRSSLLLLLIVLPLWSGFLLRVMAWIGLLRDEGWINAVLVWFGFGKLVMLHTDFAMILGIVYAYLPFLILPVQARLAAADPALEMAAADLGASPSQVFRRVTLPLSLPGVVAGFLLVFIPATGEFVIPALLGAPDSLTMGRVIWDSFFQENDWPQAAALSVVLLGVLLGPFAVVRK